MGIETSSYLSDNLSNKWTQTLTAFSVGFIIIIVGLPIWWKTTEVYRANLPYEKIHELNDNRKINMKFTLFVGCMENDSSCYHIEQEFIAVLRKELSHAVHRHISVQYTVIYEKQSSSKKISSFLKLVLKTGLQFEMMVSKSRTVFCTLPNKWSLDKLTEHVKDIAHLIQHNLVAEQELEQLVASIYQTGQVHHKKIKSMVRSSRKLELLFSLMCPEPDNHLVTWDIEKTVEKILMPALKKLKPLFDFSVGSQIIYYCSIPYHPQMKKDVHNKVQYRYLTPQQLSLIINPVETRLGSHISADPTLNFVVYTTEEKYVPLYIQMKNGLSKTNAFLVPQWGGMMFHNIFNTSDDLPNASHEIDMELVMNIFFPQLRELLGIKMPSSHAYKFEEPGQDGLADWEVDYLFHLRAIENVAVSTQTLSSLSNLLSRIRNIVINDHIATQVYRAVDATVSAKEHLNNGDLVLALAASKDALTSSETAFFDPTLLELLYFPEDQKFAIYIPLFLPISLPIMLSLYHAFTRLLKRNQNNVSKSKDD